VLPLQDDPTLTDDTIAYRAYSRALDEDGRVQSKDFLQRPTEDTLSIALTQEDALDELCVRGCVPITIGDIRAVRLEHNRLGIVRKLAEPNCLEVTGIDHETAEGVSVSLSARAGKPIENRAHWTRVKAARLNNQSPWNP
jgi:hypothetical protein